MAANIMNNLATHGPTRGLFHDAMLLLFPVLYHFWKRLDYYHCFKDPYRSYYMGSVAKNLTQMHMNDKGAYQPLRPISACLLAGKNNEYTCLNIKFPDSSKYVYQCRLN